MQALKQLIEIGLSPRMDKIETFSPYQEDHSSMSYKLYSGIKEGRFSTEEEAAKALYNEKPDGSKFNMLKKRLKDRLYNTILFLKPLGRGSYSNFSYIESTYYCFKHFSVAKLLILVQAYKAGFQLLGRVLSRAQEYELHEVVLLSTLSFRTYSLQKGKQAEYEHYDNLYLQTLKLIQAEANGEALYQSVLFHFANKISFERSLIEEAGEKMEQLKELRNKYKTYQLHYQHFYISLVYYQVNAEGKKALKACDEYEEYLKLNTKFLSRIRYANFLLLKMDVALQLKDVDIVKDCFEKALPLFPVAHANWFMLHELYFALLLKKGRYREAAELMKNVQGNKKNFSDMPMRNREIWSIYQGYLWLALSYKGLTGLRNEIFRDIKSFKLGKLLNEIPSFQKDKQGYNISVLILQILIYHQEGNDRKCVKRAESLKQYVFKHLKEDETYRNQLFIRMLLRAVELEFDLAKLGKDTFIKRWLAKLQATKPDFTPIQNRIEVLPYEELWQVLMKG